MNKLRTILLALLLSCSAISFGQFSGLDLLGGEEQKEIPFEYINGFIVVDIIYGGFYPLKFLFDTGASHNILFKKNVNDILGIEYTDTIMITGADLSSDMHALVSRNIPIQFANTKRINRDIIVLEEDFVELERVLGKQVDGLLGGDFFKGLVIGIDMRKSKITLHNPETFSPERGFSKHKLQITNYKPYLDCSTIIQDDTFNLKYLLDTGAALALLVQADEKTGTYIPDNVIVGSLGKGLGGEIAGYIGVCSQLDIGEYQINDIIASFQSIDSIYAENEMIIRDGIIGNVILSRFNVVIDYVKEVCYLKPTSDLNDKFEYDKSGILIYAFGEKLNEYYIKAIYPNTPASEVGLKAGDRIKKMGFWPIKFYSLQSLTRKLKGKEGKKIKICIERDGEEMKFEFKLRNLFKRSHNNKNKKG